MGLVGTDQKERERDTREYAKTGEHTQKVCIHVHFAGEEEQYAACNHNEPDQPAECRIELARIAQSGKKIAREGKSGLLISADEIPENTSGNSNEKNNEEIPYAPVRKAFCVICKLELHPTEKYTECPRTEDITADL